MINFMGAQVLEYEQRVTRDYRDVTALGDPMPVKILVGEETRVNVVVVLTYDIMDKVQALWSDTSGFSVRNLGPGYQCIYCGAVWLPGTLICPSCGGNTESIKQIVEMERLAQLVSMRQVMHVADVSRLELEIYLHRNPGLVTGDISAILFSKPGPWLCQHCGLFVDGDRNGCPGCGGRRMPVHKLARLERVCVYCGQKTMGGFACPRCRGRLA